LRDPDGKRDAELTNLLKACVRLICKSESSTAFAIKGRNWLIEIGDLLHDAFPNAKNLFLYRDAISWSNSLQRVYEQNNIDYHSPATQLGIAQLFSHLHPLFTKYSPDNPSISDASAVSWLSCLHRYLELHKKGIPFLAIRYEDLNAQREQTTKVILEYCAVDTSHVNLVLKVFEHDSQAGTVLARDNPKESHKPSMSAEHQERICEILQQHPIIKTPDFTVPGTSELQ
jgi:hypothetical protein